MDGFFHDSKTHGVFFWRGVLKNHRRCGVFWPQGVDPDEVSAVFHWLHVSCSVVEVAGAGDRRCPLSWLVTHDESPSQAAENLPKILAIWGISPALAREYHQQQWGEAIV